MPYRFFEREGYIEVQFFGRLAGDEPLTRAERAAIDDLKAVLFDFAEVERMDFDPFILSSPLQQLVSRGARLAIAAENPVWFGMGRQMAGWASLDREVMQVFQDRSSALEWLGHGDAAAS